MSSDNKSGTPNERIRVAVRVRPPVDNRTESLVANLEIDNDVISISASEKRSHKFAFDRVFGRSTAQSDIHLAVGRPCVRSLLDGYNTTIFAYGQTGSGKTFTMYGKDCKESRKWDSKSLRDSDGLVPRMTAELFSELVDRSDEVGTLVRRSSKVSCDETISETNSASTNAAAADDDDEDDDRSREHEEEEIVYAIKCSFVEIYNETVRDLLVSSSTRGTRLRVRETDRDGVWIEGATQTFVTSANDVSQLVRAGLERRTVASTLMNQHSSRSHCVFTLHLHQSGFSNGTTKTSCMNLVDLAGSERVLKSGVSKNGESAAFREARSINQSLTCLGSCIHALTESNRKHIPYRDSTLTHMLKESLGGNARTYLITTVSSMASDVAESIGTLRFGSRAKTVQLHAQVNVQKSAAQLSVELATMRRLVETLEEENANLRLICDSAAKASNDAVEETQLSENVVLKATISSLLAQVARLGAEASSARREREDAESTIETMRERVRTSRSHSVSTLGNAWETLRRREEAVSLREQDVERNRRDVQSALELRVAEEKVLAAKKIKEQDEATKGTTPSPIASESTALDASSQDAKRESPVRSRVGIIKDEGKARSQRTRHLKASRATIPETMWAVTTPGTKEAPSSSVTTVTCPDETESGSQIECRENRRDGLREQDLSPSSKEKNSGIEKSSFDKLWEAATQRADLAMLSDTGRNPRPRPRSAYDHARYLSAALREKREQLRSQLDAIRSPTSSKSKGVNAKTRKRIVRVVGSRRCTIESIMTENRTSDGDVVSEALHSTL